MLLFLEKLYQNIGSEDFLFHKSTILSHTLTFPIMTQFCPTQTMIHVQEINAGLLLTDCHARPCAGSRPRYYQTGY